MADVQIRRAVAKISRRKSVDEARLRGQDDVLLRCRNLFCGGLWLQGAKCRTRAAPAFWGAGFADVAAMQDEPEMGRFEHLLRDAFEKRILDRAGRGPGC